MTLAFFLALCVNAPLLAVESAPQYQSVKLNEVPRELAPVDFLAEAPVIDGVLDPGLRDLPHRAFSQVDLYETAEKPVDAHYRLAYGTDFLYVYVEARGDRLTYNDRAYQNGDGFHMVIARPRPGDAPSDEFYVAACSAVDRPELDWSRWLFWYYNVDKLFIPMSRAARLEFAAHDGVISFELLRPWQDLHPYHPWLSDGIGFNLGFVKASGQGAFYFRVLPDDLGAENVPRRYVRLRFAEPSLSKGMQTFVELERNHLGPGEALRARAVTLSAGPEPGSENLGVSVLSGEGTGLESTTTEYPCTRGLTVQEFQVNLGDLPPGGYRVAWRSRRDDSRGDDSTRASGVTVLPATAPELHARRLESSKARLSLGSATTLRFLLDEAFASLGSLKPYETAAKERMALQRIEADLGQAEAGRDMLATRTGFLRRAFLSRIDNTLQPYSVRIPSAYDPKAGKKYPLIVFLHGSASDETDLAGVDFLSEGDVIELAPCGRGPSNAFTRDHAQEDIEEAIEAVIRSYPIDATRIILTGFSMGGYGVYRTFYEHPARYRALAVLSGLPDVGDEFSSGVGHPSFLDERNLAKFKGVPVFIFHGREDRNCPFNVTQELVGKLGRAGARVEFVTEDGAGHERPAPGALARYRAWLRTVMSR